MSCALCRSHTIHTPLLTHDTHTTLYAQDSIRTPLALNTHTTHTQHPHHSHSTHTPLTLNTHTTQYLDHSICTRYAHHFIGTRLYTQCRIHSCAYRFSIRSADTLQTHVSLTHSIRMLQCVCCRLLCVWRWHLWVWLCMQCVPCVCVVSAPLGVAADGVCVRETCVCQRDASVSRV